jgi:hypothetical protein
VTRELDRIRLEIPENVITRVIDGTIVVLDVDTGRSFTLDEIGSRVWTLLTTEASAQAACNALAAEYAAEPEEIRADVEGLIEALTANGLLIEQTV